MKVLADGRVRRTAAEWRKVVGAFEASGLSVLAYCEREGISRSVFTRWRRELAGAATSPGDAFVELPMPAAPAPPMAVGPGELELSLPGGVTLRWKS